MAGKPRDSGKPMKQLHLMMPPDYLKAASQIAKRLGFETVSLYLRARLRAAIDQDK